MTEVVVDTEADAEKVEDVVLEAVTVCEAVMVAVSDGDAE